MVHELLHVVGEALTHSVSDSLQMVPILFAVYLLMEFLEGRMGRVHRAAGTFRRFGPLIGAAVGCLPQCGFSAAAASLYGKGLITGGTLIAVLLSTSDEAIPVMLAGSAGWQQIAALLAAKVVIATAAGYLLQATVFRSEEAAEDSGAHSHHHEHKGCGGSCCGKERFSSPILNLIWRAAVRTVQVALFVMLTVTVIEIALHLIGEDQLGRILLTGSPLQPLLTAAIGLIPGCAVSIILTELYIGGSLSFGAAVAGLATGAGVGYLVLVRECKDRRRVLRIIGLTYLCSAVPGLLLGLIGR